MNRRQFIEGIGLFTILPGAGRLWKAERRMLVFENFSGPVGFDLQEWLNELYQMRRLRMATCYDEAYIAWTGEQDPLVFSQLDAKVFVSGKPGFHLSQLADGA